MTLGMEELAFLLPEHLSATRPAEARGLARDQVRLLVADGGTITHARFRELPAHLRPGDLVVVNNSAMINGAVDVRYHGEPAVLHFSTGLDDGGWVVEVRDPAGVPWRGRTVEPGGRLDLPAGRRAMLRDRWLSGSNRLWVVDVTDEDAAARAESGDVGREPRGRPTDVPALLARYGRPITYSYVAQRWSADYYRTVFGLLPGSAEMPSASRPFTESLVTELIAGGVGFAPITLHCGVSSPEAAEPPSPERFAVPEMTARLVNATRAAGGRVVAVGTTVTRALESACGPDGSVRAAAGWTDLVLDGSRPARAVDGLVTGWHAPGASHLLLLESVAGPRVVREAYRAALESGYLWHEFGDSALLLRD
ncbi:S-adenosylmethionine:tRNA ribosyltransferase-isomerase [Nocardia yunnanensis]|uniref:S-adenosylmethionine:tRNA ribosyltransferase-isomerase n=1 Tax=Nocardia yunnanensis TaxID=2382165 RepID=A0A386ZBT5_9NOCA|nr:S-adenosylmethionine:tRNA ribosyltransferase-isomerase [Nocardia yunnanensis]AYF73969.1 S-adenosylmethionine:tRNA ribosyltransferase-isomerase [Nocardia yunnanensis]